MEKIENLRNNHDSDIDLFVPNTNAMGTMRDLYYLVALYHIM